MNIISLISIGEEYLSDGVSTKLPPPLEHVCPHLFCFLNVKLPSSQESGSSYSKLIAHLELCNQGIKGCYATHATTINHQSIINQITI